MKCKAYVTAASLSIRARQSPTEPTCQRQARLNGLCYQHAAMKQCDHPGCSMGARTREAGRNLCHKHAPLWAAHTRIVNRILRIPPR